MERPECERQMAFSLIAWLHSGVGFRSVAELVFGRQLAALVLVARKTGSCCARRAGSQMHPQHGIERAPRG